LSLVETLWNPSRESEGGTVFPFFYIFTFILILLLFTFSSAHFQFRGCVRFWRISIYTSLHNLIIVDILCHLVILYSLLQYTGLACSVLPCPFSNNPLIAKCSSQTHQSSFISHLGPTAMWH
jgi:hypothetical protein